MQAEINIFEMLELKPLMLLLFIGHMSLISMELILSDPAMQAILNGNETYDAVITEWFLTDALQGVAYRLQAPSILATTFGPSILTNYLAANPSVYSYMPHPFSGYSQRMNFWERVNNFFLATIQYFFNNLYYLPQHNKLLHKYIPDAPSIYELNANVALQLFNSDPVINGPLPKMPNLVEIGGIHIKASKTLPKYLQKYIDESKDGVIYFSMGSNLKSKDLPQATREAILRVLAKQKERVLWKFEENLPGKPRNVEIRKWLPQQDILAHPNVKLFITHGGLLSTMESLYHGVPIIGISVFGDQALNMKNAENKGYGISLPYKEFTEDKFSEALDRMLRNSSYSEAAKQISVLLKDKQAAPVDTAVYWVEYIIRHKGAKHLRNAAHDLNWWQYYSIDVILFLTSITAGAIAMCYILTKKLLCRKKKKKQKLY